MANETKKASKLFSATFIVTLVVGIIFQSAPFLQQNLVARLLVSGDGVLTGYTRLHTCKYAGGTGDRNWTDDGQLPWCENHPGWRQPTLSQPMC